MGLVGYAVWINATPERVCAVYVDPTRIPDWQTGRPSVVSARAQPGVPASRYVSKRGPVAATTTVVAAEAPPRLTPGSRPTSALTLEVTSRLVEKAEAPTSRLVRSPAGADGGGSIATVVERAILSPADARKE